MSCGIYVSCGIYKYHRGFINSGPQLRKCRGSPIHLNFDTNRTPYAAASKR